MQQSLYYPGQTGEGSDATSDPMADYLALSQEEQDELVQLTNMKADGTFKKLIVVVASSNSIDSRIPSGWQCTWH